MYHGRHTCLPWVFEHDVHRTVPLLVRTGGAPPYVLLVGDRRRAARVLARLEDGFDLAAHAAAVVGAAAEGRVAVGVGRTGGVPVMVVETQMGGPATEIIVREVLDASFHPEDGKARAAIRVGSCGMMAHGDVFPDLAIASFATGWSGAIEQCRRGVVGWTMGEVDPPQVPCSPAVVTALEAGIRRVAPDVTRATSGVFSKDSLYAEQDDAFGAVMARLGCVATEMELATIAPIAAEMGVPWGGIMASAGFVPDGPWLERAEIERNENLAIDVALAAIRILAA